MQVKLTAAGHNAWKEGEIITIQVKSVDEEGYTCETIETYPADLKDQHKIELSLMNANHLQAVAEINARHRAEIEGLRAVPVEAPVPVAVEAVQQPETDFNKQHLADLEKHQESIPQESS